MKPFGIAWAAVGLAALASAIWFLGELAALREASDKGLMLTISPYVLRYADRDFGSQHTVFVPTFGVVAFMIVATALGLLFAQALRWRRTPR